MRAHASLIAEKLDMPYRTIISHARFVLASKIVLSLLAVLLVLLLVALPLTRPAEKQFKLTYTPQQSETPSLTVMNKPRYQGIDNKNQPYTITAESATQPSMDSIVLTKPTADITMSDGKWLSLLANKATFIISQKKLELNGSVNLFTGDGYELRTNSAFVNVLEGTASGHEAVEIQGMPGTLKATGFALKNQGNNIIFTGPVRMVLFPVKK